MKLVASFEINGVRMLNEAYGWEQARIDGHYVLRFPPMSADEAERFAHELTHPSSLVAVSVRIEGLPTVIELATRLAAVESAVRAIPDYHTRLAVLEHATGVGE